MKDSITIFQFSDPYDSDDIDTSDRKINTSKITNIEFDDVDLKDYPDFCDAYVYSADMYGHAMSEGELNDLNDNYRDFVYEKLIDYLY